MSESPPVQPSENAEVRRQRERERAQMWLQEKWTRPQQCPICGTNSWIVSEVMELRAFEGGALVFGGGGGLYPVFQVTCGNCGMTYIFNAVLSGVVESGGAPA